MLYVPAVRLEVRWNDTDQMIAFITKLRIALWTALGAFDRRIGSGKTLVDSSQITQEKDDHSASYLIFDLNERILIGRIVLRILSLRDKGVSSLHTKRNAIYVRKICESFSGLLL